MTGNDSDAFLPPLKCIGIVNLESVVFFFPSFFPYSLGSGYCCSGYEVVKNQEEFELELMVIRRVQI